MTFIPRHAIALLLTVLAVTAHAADFPQWRAEHDGISKETGLLKKWPEGGPKMAWKNDKVGEGYSTPAVAGGRIYLMGNDKAEESAYCLNEKDGKPIWTVKVGKVGPNQGPQYPGSRSTPTVDGDRVYCLTSNGELACLKTANGDAIWTKSFRTDFAGKPGMWAYSESVLIDGDVLVATPGGGAAALVALNKMTGDVIWKTANPEADEADYASIIIADVDGTKEYVQFLRKGLVGVDAKTGKLLWRYSKTIDPAANIPTPFSYKDSIYTAAARSGGALLKLSKTGDGIKVDEVYFDKNLNSAIGGFVRLGDYVYGTNGKGLQCWELATGKVLWSDKTVTAGGICYADGHLYVRDEKNGKTILVEATPEAFRLKGTLEQPDRSKAQAWQYPVIANGKLYLRDQNVLLCYDVAAH